MIRTIKQKAVSLLLVLAFLIFSFAGFDFIGIKASAYGISPPKDTDEVLSRLNAIIYGQYGDGAYFPYPFSGGVSVPAELAGAEGAYECMGYARYVFYQTFGLIAPSANYLSRPHVMDEESEYTSNLVPIAVCNGEASESRLKDDIFKSRRGDWFQAGIGSAGHSMIILTYDDSSVTVLDCNNDGRCTVAVRTMDWERCVYALTKSGSNKSYTIYRSKNYPPTVPMTPPTQSFDKDSYIVGDTVKVTWVGSSLNSGIQRYWLELKNDATLETVMTGSALGTDTSYSFTVGEPGNYTLYICADNGSTQLPSTIGKITVYQNLKPQVTITPNGGSFTDTQTVTIETMPSEFTKIYYTTDGTDPTASSIEYSGAFTISKSTIVKAYAVNTLVPTYKSEIVSATFTKDDTPHTHNWGDWSISKDPTLSETGLAMHICFGTNPHTEYIKIPCLTDSIWTKGGSVDPTCKSDGSQEYTSMYGTVTISVPKTEHNWGEWTYYPMSEAAPACRMRTCKICSEVQSEDIICDGVNHALEKREAVEATCTQTGRIEFWVCGLCNRMFADANGTTLINDVTAPIKEHNWGEWITYPATEAAEAYRTRNCKTCGEVQTEVLVCDGKNHTLEKRESIEATCTETGRIEFWVCSLCNMKFADVNGNKPINDITVPAKGHNWNNGVVTKPATTTSAGVKTFTCTVCGETKTESISKLPNSGSGASSGSGSSSSRRPSITSSSTTAETVIVNGLSKTWAETVTTIDSTAINGIVTISGSTDTPSNVIAAAAKKNVKLEVRVNDTFTWVIDAAKMDEGSKYLSVSDSVITETNKTIKSIEYYKDFRITESKLGTGSTLRYNAGRTNSGKFANLFKVDGSNLIFVGVSMADTAGNALLPITTAGTYKIVTSNETKLVGDLNNSMNLNALDAAIMLKKLVNGNIPAEEVAKFDFNGDGNANALDAATILKYILNK